MRNDTAAVCKSHTARFIWLSLDHQGILQTVVLPNGLKSGNLLHGMHAAHVYDTSSDGNDGHDGHDGHDTPTQNDRRSLSDRSNIRTCFGTQQCRSVGPHQALHFLVLHQVGLEDFVRAAGDGTRHRSRPPVLAAHFDVVEDRAFRVRVTTRLGVGMGMGVGVG